MFEKDWNISYLLDFYGEILPEKKRGVMELYYNEDLSLSEIADQIRAVIPATNKSSARYYGTTN